MAILIMSQAGTCLLYVNIYILYNLSHLCCSFFFFLSSTPQWHPHNAYAGLWCRFCTYSVRWLVWRVFKGYDGGKGDVIDYGGDGGDARSKNQWSFEYGKGNDWWIKQTHSPPKKKNVCACASYSLSKYHLRGVLKFVTILIIVDRLFASFK